MEHATDGEDQVARTEIHKDRVRQLLRRLGILFQVAL